MERPDEVPPEPDRARDPGDRADDDVDDEREFERPKEGHGMAGGQEQRAAEADRLELLGLDDIASHAPHRAARNQARRGKDGDRSRRSSGRSRIRSDKRDIDF